MIVSAYLTRNKGPRVEVRPNEHRRVAKLEDAATRLGLHCVVMHDGLEEGFQKAHPALDFRLFDEPYGMTPNDWRFFIAERLLQEERPRWAFITDLWDVTIKRVPEPQSNRLYLGAFGKRLGGDHFGMKRARMLRAQWLVDFLHGHSNERMMNAWLVGGELEVLLHFLDRFRATHHKLGHPSNNVNNLLVNFLAHTEFRDIASTEMSSMRDADVPFVHGACWVPKNMG